MIYFTIVHQSGAVFEHGARSLQEFERIKQASVWKCGAIYNIIYKN